MKDKIEVGMLSPLMAEFIPDYSDIVNLDDAEPLEGPDLVQYQTSIAEKVDEINRLGMPDNQPSLYCPLRYCPTTRYSSGV